jgi:hypothetical protein
MIRLALARYRGDADARLPSLHRGCGRPHSGPRRLWCSDDDAAKAQAAPLVDGHDVELWQEGRKVADFKHKD